MRDYGKVYSSIWSSADFRALSEDGRTLVLYLLTSHHGTIAGVFRLPDGYACEDMQWEPARVVEAFGELLSKGFANRCETTKWVWVSKFLEWNPPENPNQRKAASKMACSVPDQCSWKSAFMRVCGPLLGIEPPQEANGSPTVTEQLLNQKQEQEQEQKQNKTDAHLSAGDAKPQAVKAEPPGFTNFWADWPKSERKGGKAKCLEAWRKARLEDSAPEILAHLASMKDSPTWRKEAGQYIPAPLAYLNGRKWDGADVQVESSYAGAV